MKIQILIGDLFSISSNLLGDPSRDRGVPHMVRAKRKQKVRPTEPAAAAAVALVLGDDDLLGEILLRLDYATCLVRAAAVCRRWLRCASDPAFLRRFRALHPPRILGIRGVVGGYPIRFFPVPQPKELAAVAASAAGALRDAVYCDCRNGRFLFHSDAWTDSYVAVRSLLKPGPDKPLPRRPFLIRTRIPSFDNITHVCHRLLLEDDGDATSCLFLHLACNGVEFSANFFILQAGIWGGQGSAVTELKQGTRGETGCYAPLVSGRKVNMVTNVGCILVLDLAIPSFFTIDLPLGTGQSGIARLSRAQQSGLYLIDVARFHLHIWHGDDQTTLGSGCWWIPSLCARHVLT